MDDIKVLKKAVSKLERRAKKGDYSDFSSKIPMPKLSLQGDLADIENKAASMMMENIEGKYDE